MSLETIHQKRLRSETLGGPAELSAVKFILGERIHQVDDEG